MNRPQTSPNKGVGDGSAGPPSNVDEVSPPPRSLPPVVPSLPPPVHAATPEPRVDLSAQHRWLGDPRIALLRRSVSDEHLLTLHRWGIDPTWTTNQIVGHVHAALPKKVDRKTFETHLMKCQDKAALVELVHATLAAQPPEVAERHARMSGRTS
jgi:hypothetical protein